MSDCWNKSGPMMTPVTASKNNVPTILATTKFFIVAVRFRKKYPPHTPTTPYVRAVRSVHEPTLPMKVSRRTMLRAPYTPPAIGPYALLPANSVAMSGEILKRPTSGVKRRNMSVNTNPARYFTAPSNEWMMFFICFISLTVARQWGFSPRSSCTLYVGSSVAFYIQKCKNHFMKIISWNVNGIRAVLKKGDFVAFIEQYKPDILCLQETKAQQGQAVIDLPEYTEYWNSAVKKGYSGTAIFTKVKPIAVVNGLPDAICKKYGLVEDEYGDPRTEGRVIAAEFEDFYVVTVYTPNAKDDLSRIPLRHKQWDPAFLAYCKELESKKPVIFCGDLNVAHTPDDLARPKENVGLKGFTDEERSGFQNFIDAGFVDTFRMFNKGNGFYTWWSHFAHSRDRNIGWRIDYVLVSKILEKKVKKAEILADVMGSDHCPVTIDIG